MGHQGDYWLPKLFLKSNFAQFSSLSLRKTLQPCVGLLGKTLEKGVCLSASVTPDIQTPVLFKLRSKSFPAQFPFAWHVLPSPNTGGPLYTGKKKEKQLFCLKSYLPGECLTPSCHHRQRGGNDQAVLFSLISRVGEPRTRQSAFKAAGSVCVAQETEPEADGFPRHRASSWTHQWF